MTVTIPASVTAQGNVKAVFIPTMAGAAPTAVELAAGTDITCYLMPDWAGPTATQNTGDDARFCSTQTFTRLGRVSWEIAPLSYTYSPQLVGSDPSNKVYTALAAGTTGYVVIAYGVSPAVAIAATKKVDVFPVKTGVQDKKVTGSDEFAPLTVLQTLAVTGIVVQDAVVT